MRSSSLTKACARREYSLRNQNLFSIRGTLMLNRFPALAAVCAACIVALGGTCVSQDVQIDSDTFSGFAARAIGPAVMGGRVSDIAAVAEGQRLTIYVGA